MFAGTFHSNGIFPFFAFCQLYAIRWRKIEEREDTSNAVLVSAKTPQHIREAFRNYFDDTSDFIALYDDAAQQIRRTK